VDHGAEKLLEPAAVGRGQRSAEVILRARSRLPCLSEHLEPARSR
jgi:hypothetical protein